MCRQQRKRVLRLAHNSTLIIMTRHRRTYRCCIAPPLESERRPVEEAEARMRLGIGWLVMRASTATQRRLKPRALPCVVVGVVAFMGVAAIIGFFVDAKERGQLREYRYATRDIRSFQQALTDVETGVRGFTLSQRADYLEPYSNGMKVLDDLAPVMLPRLDRFDATRPGHQVGTMRPSDVLRILRTVWRTTMYPAPDDPLTPAAA